MKPRTNTNMTGNLLFIGDSLTEWFDWERRFPGYHVTNLGVSGETVEGLMNRRERIRTLVKQPDVVFLMTGINNIAGEQYDFLPPYREFVRNVTTWYKTAIVVVQSILPVDLAWIDNTMIRGINCELKGIAREYLADYLDVYRLFVDGSDNPKAGLLQDDGVHLSSKGYSVWADEVERFLKSAG